MLKRGPATIRVAILIALTTACGDSGQLTGEWVATSENAQGTTFVFRDDGTALWLLPDTFRLRYAVDNDASPSTLDLSGFDRGPLQGYVLYCIFEFESADTMRLDCEPGVDSDRGAGIRPGQFGAEQTQTFERP